MYAKTEAKLFYISWFSRSDIAAFSVILVHILDENWTSKTKGGRSYIFISNCSFLFSFSAYAHIPLAELLGKLGCFNKHYL